jgi:predicted DNA-binding protein with PD1-like motif
MKNFQISNKFNITLKSTNPELHLVAIVVDKHSIELSGHFMQSELINQYPTSQPVA